MGNQNKHLQQVLASKATNGGRDANGVPSIAGSGDGTITSEGTFVPTHSAAAMDTVATEQKAQEATGAVAAAQEQLNQITRDSMDTINAAILPAPPMQPQPTKAQLEKMAGEFRQKFSPQGIKRLVDGGIEVKFVVDVDMANCLLDWAEGAGQAPAEFIQRHLTEALAAYTGV